MGNIIKVILKVESSGLEAPIVSLSEKVAEKVVKKLQGHDAFLECLQRTHKIVERYDKRNGGIFLDREDGAATAAFLLTRELMFSHGIKPMITLPMAIKILKDEG